METIATGSDWNRNAMGEKIKGRPVQCCNACVVWWHAIKITHLRKSVAVDKSGTLEIESDFATRHGLVGHC